MQQQGSNLKQLRMARGDSTEVYLAALKRTLRTAKRAAPSWRDAALQSFRQILKAYGLDDGVTLRPCEWAALRNLELLAKHPEVAPPLSPLEQDVLLLETFYLANYEQRDFQRKHGYDLTRADRFAWIASRIPGLARLQVQAMLDDITYTMDALRWQTEVDIAKAGLVEEFGELGLVKRLQDQMGEALDEASPVPA